MEEELEKARDFAIKYTPYITRNDINLLCKVNGVSYYKINQPHCELPLAIYVVVKGGRFDLIAEHNIFNEIQPYLQ